MGIKKFFATKAQARSTNAAIQAYSNLYSKVRSGRAEAEDRRQFEQAADILRHGLELIPVSISGRDADLQSQLLNKDRVHDFGVRNVDELHEYRLGVPSSSTKTAYALVNPRNEDGKRDILAAIYTYWQRGEDNLAENYNALAGKVNLILHEPVRNNEAQNPKAAIFYSISTFDKMKGAGQMLIERVHASLTGDLPQGTVLSTLSPLRGLREWLKNGGAEPEQMTASGLRGAAMRFLFANKNDVQSFHMGNGAMIGAIRLCANTPGSEDDVKGCNVMVNYVYAPDPARLVANRIQYQNAILAAKSGQDFVAKSMIFSLMDRRLQCEGHSDDMVRPASVASPAVRPA